MAALPAGPSPRRFKCLTQVHKKQLLTSSEVSGTFPLTVKTPDGRRTGSGLVSAGVVSRDRLATQSTPVSETIVSQTSQEKGRKKGSMMSREKGPVKKAVFEHKREKRSIGASLLLKIPLVRKFRQNQNPRLSSSYAMLHTQCFFSVLPNPPGIPVAGHADQNV